jgi:hypothetical protein
MTAVEVYLLWHIHHSSDQHADADGNLVWDEEDGDNPKILGVYSTAQRAQDRIERARRDPGFADEPDCFMIDRYVVDRDHWEDGFVSVQGPGG